MSEATETAAAKPKVPKFGRDRLMPGAYKLDHHSPVWSVPVTLNGQPCTFGEAYCKLRDSKVLEMPDYLSLSDSDKYVASEGGIELKADWPLRETMQKLVNLKRQDIEPFGVTWLFYDHDWSRDADESHSFFAVHNGKIIMESCHFGSEEPLTLKRNARDPEPIWHSRPYFDEAWEQYWYRKFYSETMTRQLMVLRPDKPILYHFERPESRDAAGTVQLVTSAKIYRLLLILVPVLASVAFPSVREFLAIAAAVLGIDFLLLCWRTRKVGRP